MSDQKTQRQRELDLLAALPQAEYLATRPTGVLLSDQIRFYVDKYCLIDPFTEENLKPAGYELTVGDVCSIGGKTKELKSSPGQDELTIAPFEVAIVQTRERVNMPRFLIGRWNIRVRLAYKGLLWVGGPQVDPGYQGYLFCPIYNLSDATVTLHHGDAIALLDFVTTTPPTDSSSKKYPSPRERSRLLFKDYEPDKLQSALSTRAEKKIGSFETTITQMGARLDTFVQLTFGIVALLFAALAVIAGKPSEFAIWNPTIILAASALFIAMWAMQQAHSESRFIRENIAHFRSGAALPRSHLWIQIGVAILIGVVLAAFQYRYYRSFDEAINQLRQEVKELSGKVKTTSPKPESPQGR